MYQIVGGEKVASQGIESIFIDKLRSGGIRMLHKKLSNFFKDEASSGVILLVFLGIAMLLANSKYEELYNHVLHLPIVVGFNDFKLNMSLLHWINDGLMVVFFFVVGMEIKRELTIGELKSVKKSILPISAAFGGMLVPALIYAGINLKEATINGWGIPMATDIAFALGVLTIVAKNMPKGLTVFLAALAIVDDIGAIVVIAMFFTNQINIIALLLGGLIFLLLIIANRFHIQAAPVYLIGGFFLWFCFLKSGIHATIAGVLLGMVIPVGKSNEEYKTSLLYRLEHSITPWSTYVIMPVFALANSGVRIEGNSIVSMIKSPISLGIIFGLVIGKQLGIMGMSMLLIKMKLAKLPSGVTLQQLYAVSVLGGIGFTMSLFITSLSFSQEDTLAVAKISIIFASVVAALWSCAIFKLIQKRKKRIESIG